VPAPAKFRYEPSLDGLRALAVLAIIAYHFNYAWARGAYLSVDLFFILSGFLITMLLIMEWRGSNTIALRKFWSRRARRLLPALLLVLAFVAFFTHFEVDPWNRAAIRGDGIASLFYVANWRFIVDKQGYFELFSAASPLRHMWTLAIEEQFYLVWPLVVYGCMRLGKGRLRVLAGLCVVGVAGSVFLMNALFRANDPSRAYYGTDSRAHTILIGCLLALLLFVWKPTSRQARISIQVLGVVGAIVALWAWHEIGDVDPSYYGWGSLAYAVAIAAVIAAAVQPGRGVIRSPLSWRPLRWIGTISYGLYLWHWPIDIWLVHWRVGFGGTGLNALRLVVTFGFATASYYLVERPIRRGAFNRPGRPQLRWVAPAGVVLVALTLMISTAGATKVPSYFVVAQHPSACQLPRPSELKAAREALADSDAKPAVDPALKGTRVLLVGDSIACSLQPGMMVVGSAAGLKVSQASAIGCGIASGEIASSDVFVPPNSQECPDLNQRVMRAALKKSTPDVILWLSTWERADLVVGDRTLHAGTKAWEREILRRMDHALAKLRATGAKVLITTQASTAPAKFHVITEAQQNAQDEGFARLNQLLVKFAGRHPNDVTLVDLANTVCPGGVPCPEVVDGITLRPFDGGHFSPEGAVWASEWLLPYLEKAGEAHAAGA
jgi:peptidoglycan/LPS O-acetylase OafA/YrhL